MILTCPQCDTRYHVDPGSLGPSGRRVRCSSCHHRWLAQPPPDTPKVLELGANSAAQSPRARPGAAVAAKARGRGSASLVAWLAGVLVVLILASAVIGRNEIVSGFPDTSTMLASPAVFRWLNRVVLSLMGGDYTATRRMRCKAVEYAALR